MGHPERASGGEAEHRSDPLAAGQQRVAHRLVQASGERLLGEVQPLEVCLDLLAQMVWIAGLHAERLGRRR